MVSIDTARLGSSFPPLRIRSNSESQTTVRNSQNFVKASLTSPHSYVLRTKDSSRLIIMSGVSAKYPRHQPIYVCHAGKSSHLGCSKQPSCLGRCKTSSSPTNLCVSRGVAASTLQMPAIVTWWSTLASNNRFQPRFEALSIQHLVCIIHYDVLKGGCSSGETQTEVEQAFRRDKRQIFASMSRSKIVNYSRIINFASSF